jgi:GNAT superfamily N-acetyltransferase
MRPLEAVASHIRAAVIGDEAALMHLFEALDLFGASELIELESLLARYFAGELGADHAWIAFDDGTLSGAAYYALDASQERAGPGIWNLYFIGVQPDRQGAGCGSALLAHVEWALRGRDARELLVETSGAPSFARTRVFYASAGYNEIARIPEFYGPGDDKVILRKALGRDTAS